MAAAFVMEKMIAIVGGDVHVVAAIVVVVPNSHADAIQFHIQTAPARDVGERSVVIIAIQRSGSVTSARRPVLTVDEENVQPAVAIGIEERDARSHGLGKPLLPGAAGVVDKVYARGGGYVRELDRLTGRWNRH